MSWFGNADTNQALLFKGRAESGLLVGFELVGRLITTRRTCVASRGRTASTYLGSVRRLRRSSILSLPGPGQWILLPVVINPAIVECDQPGLAHGYASLQRVRHDRTLGYSICHRARGMTKGDIKVSSSWWVGSLGDGAGRRKPDGGEATSFEMTCDQTDRLVANRSNGHQQYEVGFLRLDLDEDVLGRLGHQSSGGIDPAHETNGLVCYRSDGSVGCEFP